MTSDYGEVLQLCNERLAKMRKLVTRGQIYLWAAAVGQPLAEAEMFQLGDDLNLAAMDCEEAFHQLVRLGKESDVSHQKELSGESNPQDRHGGRDDLDRPGEQCPPRD